MISIFFTLKRKFVMWMCCFVMSVVTIVCIFPLVKLSIWLETVQKRRFSFVASKKLSDFKAYQIIWQVPVCSQHKLCAYDQ